MSNVSHSQDKIAILKGPYLGQKPPSSIPEIFAPGIVSTKGWEVGHVFSPNMDEFYFIRKRQDNNKIESVIYKQKNNRWFETVIPRRVTLPFFSPDGKTIHLGKRYKEHTKDGWSDIKNLGSPYKQTHIMKLTTSNKGTYVFDEATRDGNGILRYSRLINGEREAPKPLDKVINTGKWNAHPLIAPDESYIMWDSEREGGYGDNDLYISFKQQDGSWGEAINLGDKINTDAQEGGPNVTPDGKYLFFGRNMGSDKHENMDIFWVDAQIIEDLRPK
jgi:Tol biopolymer transport system component